MTEQLQIPAYRPHNLILNKNSGTRSARRRCSRHIWRWRCLSAMATLVSRGFSLPCYMDMCKNVTRFPADEHTPCDRLRRKGEPSRRGKCLVQIMYEAPAAGQSATESKAAPFSKLQSSSEGAFFAGPNFATIWAVLDSFASRQPLQAACPALLPGPARTRDLLSKVCNLTRNRQRSHG